MKALYHVDLFRQVQDKENHLTPATRHGAIISISVTAFLLLLLCGEVINYYRGYTECHITTSTSIEQLNDAERQSLDKLHLLISFPTIPCDMLATETVNERGNVKEVEEGTKVRYFIAPYGSKERSADREFTGDAAIVSDLSGCILSVSAPITRTPSSFNIIVQKSKRGGATKPTLSHFIHEFYFGEHREDWGVPQITSTTTQPLSKTSLDATSAMSQFFQYYLQLIPTVVRIPGEEEAVGYQYTSHLSLVHFHGNNRAPGLYFSYRLSPVAMACSKQYDNFRHFLVNLCAVVGGVYTVAGLVEAAVEWVSYKHRLRQKGTTASFYKAHPECVPPTAAPS